MRDIMGLTSYLKEQKRCNMVLILNDDQLAGDDKVSFARYNEKVVDASLLFDPDPTYYADIAVNDTGQIFDWLRHDVASLTISNIRHIKIIERLIYRIEPLLRDFHQHILRRTVQSITLLCWSIYSDGSAPPLEFILDEQKLFGDKKELTENERQWYLQLKMFGFSVTDKFDFLLLDGIKRGFFVQDLIINHAQSIQKNFEAGKGAMAVRAAWELYHDSFDDNEKDVVNTISNAYHNNAQFIDPTTLDPTVRLFKESGCSEEAASIIQLYMQEHGEDRDLFDLSKYPFAHNITDPDVLAAFDHKYHSFKDDRDPLSVFLQKNDRSREDILRLSNLSVEDFYKIFKDNRGDTLISIIRTSLSFRNSTDDDRKKITENAEKALVRIGKESLINRLRVRQFGVEIVD